MNATNILPALSVFLTAVGWLAHLSAKWIEHRDNIDPKAGPVDFLRATPARTAFSFFGAVGAVGTLYGMGWLNPALGLTCGIATNSVVDNIVKRASL